MKNLVWSTIQFTPFFYFTNGTGTREWRKLPHQHGTGGKFACLPRGGNAFLIDLNTWGPAEQYWEWN